MTNQLKKIEHIVVLMLENRSFDQMLGFLYSADRPAAVEHFDGLTGNESNPDDHGREIAVYKIKAGDTHTYLMPGADPGEGFLNTTYQLYSTDEPSPGEVPTNKGFVLNFKSAIASDLAKHYKDTIPGTLASQIMGMYTPETLPVLSGLARGYAVCDAWFASVPTMTMPNRAFALAATSQGHLDDHVKIFTCPSIFGRLTDAKKDWAIYGYNRDPLTRHDFPDTQHADESHFGHFRDFKERASAGKLPQFTFLEPSWDATGNSQHPNYDVAAGEQLIHDVYYAVRNGKNWASTLLIITYDEHGGNYDHVPPPTDATPPNDGTVGEQGFDFTRFGVRVPAVLVSPLIRKNTVFRASAGRIDHTSILKTVHELWGTAPLTDRDKAAASLAGVLTLATPRTDDPLEAVMVPVPSVHHPNSSTPSKLDKIHAARVAALPLRSEKGHYEQATPSLTSAAEVSDFIRDRTAAWKEHLRRQRQRQEE
ncbi:alkaline phosphatase family protein [Burkholderia sp. Ac-20365]|uniref:alkaline phosphatase family protein n=1 Tax=Burkholderia sp. Ac-20365 TaxID=2703897 RepID=UPI00197B2513|nr:phosphoesterase [Burkholderia sp. Ac-20365]